MSDKLSRNDWIDEVSEILQKEPFQMREQDADSYATSMAESYYDDEYYEPENAVNEDASNWDD